MKKSTKVLSAIGGSLILAAVGILGVREYNAPRALSKSEDLDAYNENKSVICNDPGREIHVNRPDCKTHNPLPLTYWISPRW